MPPLHAVLFIVLHFRALRKGHGFFALHLLAGKNMVYYRQHIQKARDSLGQVVVVAEKPSVARDIARVLRANEKHEGYLSREGVVVTWALGHLVSLCEPDELDPAYKKWRMADLPMLPESIPLKVLYGRGGQFKIVKKLICAKETERVVCATDAGREGELIFRFIYQHAGCQKPVERLWISSMTDEAIKEGLRTLKKGEEYDNLFRSALCRAEADWLVGMNATRAYTLRYGSLLSLGRVQTPTLAILVRRQQEIDQFEPKDFWEVKAKLEGFEAVRFDEKTGETRLFEEAQAKEIAARAKGHEAVVEKAEQKEKKYAHPLLPDLTTLQREANRAYGFSAEKTLSLAQALYEKHKLITYPRTDSRYLTEDIAGKFPKILSSLQPTPYAPFAEYAQSAKAPEGKRVFNAAQVRDHHAIIPTGAPVRLEKLSEQEKQLYDLVARHFLAIFYPDRRVSDVEAILRIGTEPFKSRGRSTLEPGWTQVFSEGEKEESMLPPMAAGDVLKVAAVGIHKGRTKPPPQHTEATLLSMMEHAGEQIEDEALREQMKDSGLGTPATRAAIIERLIKVGYVKRIKKALVPTEKGMSLIGLLPEEITSATTTGKWERALSRIAEGKMEPEKFRASIMRFSAYLVQQARTAPAGVIPREEYKKKAAPKGKAQGNAEKAE